MRALFAGIFVLLVTGMCVAQTESQVEPNRDSGALFQVTPLAPRNVLRVDPLPLLPDQAKQSTEDSKLRVEGIVRPEAGCFTMRTYQFSKGSIGAAPKLMGYTTCVPSKSLELRQTGPRLKFVPQ